MGTADFRHQRTAERRSGQMSAVKRIVTTRLATPVTAKWSLWALRFQSRFYRQGGERRMAMLLHAHHGRASITIGNRWLRSIVYLEPKLSLALTSASAPASVSLITQTFNRQVHAPRTTHVAVAQIMRSERVHVSEPAATLRIERNERVTRIPGERWHEITHRLERRLTRLHLADRHTTARLIQRIERTIPAPIANRPLILRREAAPTAPAATKAVEARMLEQERKTAALERVARPVMPAINVNQLADQVIQQIDRRIIARRERLGRI